MKDGQFKPRRADVDWLGMQAEWVAGVVPVKLLSEKYGVPRPTIERYWRKQGVARNLNGKINAKASQILAVGVAGDHFGVVPKNDRAIIDGNAEIQATIRRDHQRIIGRSRGLAEKLLGELEAISNETNLLGLLADMATADQGGDARRKARDAMRKIIDTGGRVESLVKITQAISTLVRLEREAFGIRPDGGGDGNQLETFLAGVRDSIEGESRRVE